MNRRASAPGLATLAGQPTGQQQQQRPGGRQASAHAGRHAAECYAAHSKSMFIFFSLPSSVITVPV